MRDEYVYRCSCKIEENCSFIYFSGASSIGLSILSLGFKYIFVTRVFFKKHLGRISSDNKQRHIGGLVALFETYLSSLNITIMELSLPILNSKW